MFSLLHISPENMVWLYLAPLVVFGPIFFGVLWNFGLKNIFYPPQDLAEYQRLEREQSEHISQRRTRKSGTYTRPQHMATQFSAQWLGQVVVLAGVAGVLGAFSAWPSYRYREPGMAQVKLSLSHPGERVEPCRKRTAEELASLAPNMRAKMKCTRERWPITVKLWLDGEVVFAGQAAATGLHQDGSSSFYEKISVPAGSHTLTVRLNDAGPHGGVTQELSQAVVLAPAQNLVIGFHEDGRGFYLK